MVTQSEINDVSRSIASAVARQSHNDYHEPVWGDGRARLAAQQVQFQLEDWLRKHRIEIAR